jgi:hypothetical protein
VLLTGTEDLRVHLPQVLFANPASGRAKVTGAALERKLQRRVARFREESLESFFGSSSARRGGLHEHPGQQLGVREHGVMTGR